MSCVGFCFEGYGPYDEDGNPTRWRKKKGSKCSCKLYKCQRCKQGVPECLIQCFEYKYCGYPCLFDWKKDNDNI